MAHFEITSTIKTPSTKVRPGTVEFTTAIASLEVGQGFSFPIDITLKGPLSSWKALARGCVEKSVRFRWWIEDETGDGVVKRVS